MVDKPGMYLNLILLSGLKSMNICADYRDVFQSNAESMLNMMVATILSKYALIGEETAGSMSKFFYEENKLEDGKICLGKDELAHRRKKSAREGREAPVDVENALVKGAKAFEMKSCAAVTLNEDNSVRQKVCSKHIFDVSKICVCRNRKKDK